jgi:ABC-2 type transport system ATP-binding protein
MIEVRGLTKRYGPVLAVDDLSFTVAPNKITGFVGPNGAGKSTTMRMILGLDRPDRGSALVAGRAYRDLPAPMRAVGAMLDAGKIYGSRTAHAHLLCLAQSNGIPSGRVGEVLELVGLSGVARRNVGQFSLGMSQRLGLAAAMLGDPPALILDEPSNGLDPEGIVWLRNLLRALAAAGRTILISSHLMAEMALTADHLVIVGRGRLVADTSVEEFVDAAAPGTVLVRTGSESFAQRLAANGADVSVKPDGALLVSGMDSAEIGKLAAADGTALSELVPQRRSLEEAFMELTRNAVEYQAQETVR